MSKKQPDAPTQTITARRLCDLQGYFFSYTPVNFCTGPKGDLWALLRRGQKAENWVAKSQNSVPVDYLVLCIREAGVEQIVITDDFLPLYFAQPLSNGRVLLASRRIPCNRNQSDSMNARIYHSSGAFSGNSFSIGDGVEDVQTTSNDEIWVSYFDEGVFSDHNTLSGSGLSCFDSSGRQTYEYRPSDGLDHICDCYAINAASKRDLWIYYYNQFPVVQIRDHKIHAWWSCPIHSAGRFAVRAGSILMEKGRGKNKLFHQMSLSDNGSMTEICAYRFVDSKGLHFGDANVLSRGENIYFVSDSTVYGISMSDLL